MSTTIEINKKSVKEFLDAGKKQKFIIPEYQRPYAWSEDEVQTLFDDIVEYTQERIDSPYFLGTIVSYTNDHNEQEIIDGQQRITTLSLLLRALYTKIEKMDDTKERNNFIGQIEPALWETDELSGEANKSKTLIESRVYESEYNEILNNILSTGLCDKDSKDNYTKNYLLCQKLIDQYAKDEPLTFYHLINNILNKAIVLPIKADSQDTALTIFSTLNDRGLPLSDADIFKAKIYNNIKDSEARNDFIQKWQELSVGAEYAGESIQKLFYYYMFYLRAKENDKKTTTPGLRKYYSSSNFFRLYDLELMDNLRLILNFWSVVNNKEVIDGENWSSNFEILKVLDILTSYPNEFWKYPVINYYLSYKDSVKFEDKFLLFLRKLFVNLCSRYIVTPTINAVKQNILNLNADIINSDEPKVEFKAVDKNIIREQLKNPHRNVVRMLLKLLAYDNNLQDELLPEKWEIEHILPSKWQNSYFLNSSEEEVNDVIEHLGNKIPFEKRLNIIASNGYFEKKKELYRKSKIAIVKDFSQTHSKDWKIEQIMERDVRVSDRIIEIFNLWSADINDSNKSKLTQEDKMAIELIKSRGLEDYFKK
ncbi:DUF262 domain-containing protein [Anaerococcus hydrogenalis]|uniref:DUF262 domain-containing protein n=1 Tax=Anaerococcus hydrogenalis TaxID=33029 RepID=A0A2N6UH48_9FIRM|nr:DUF262 domain-containing protein [Anaerococcus hydrogenalis]MDK7695600.1 DUF262 domain-containing HNH endonuclease family protein [Anaerococcus hydrogenalis]MDK7697359.1 DUF262 domain-containing HNH endonuclease family protein [Anaerococcus hydrogenalis]MDK7708661.1 DUF262 domain-containing HNH endonuclease family protein [Anaerococcus hydrogenalis]PMC80903.1 hypothetical protein CJ192_07975 [Anaerococcus hydrogenalis]